MKKTETRILKDMLIKKETIKSDSNSLMVENTAEGLRARVKKISSSVISQRTRSGKNKFNSEVETTTIKGVEVSYDKSKGYIKLNGTVTTETSGEKYDSSIFNSKNTGKISVKANINHTLSIKKISGSYSTISSNQTASLIQLWDNSTGSWLYPYQLSFYDLMTKDTVSIAKAQTSDVIYNIIQLTLRDGDIFNNLIIAIQFEEGDLSDFEQYGESPSLEFESPLKYLNGKYDIFLYNKQLFNLNDEFNFSQFLVISEKDDSISVTCNNANGTSTQFFNFFTKVNKKIKPNKDYWVVLEVKNVSGIGTIKLVSNNSDNHSLSQFGDNLVVGFDKLSSNSLYKYKIHSREDFTDSMSISMLRGYVQFFTGQSGSVTFRISVLQDEPDIDNFEYHKELEENYLIDTSSNPLYGENDYYYKKGGKWYVHSEWNKKIIDGSENWSLNNSKDGVYQYRMNYIDDAMSSTDMFNLPKVAYCNVKIKNTTENGNTINNLNNDNLFTVAGNKQLVVNDSASTLDEFKEKLSTIGMEIIYKKETPTETEITDENLIKQLDKLYFGFLEYEDVTNIDIDNQMSLELEFRKSKIKILEKQMSEENV